MLYPKKFEFKYSLLLETTKVSFYIFLWCHSQPQTRQTPDTSNPRHIKPQTHQTSDKEYRAANYTTDKNTFSYFKWKSVLFSSFQIGFQLKYEKVFLSVVWLAALYSLSEDWCVLGLMCLGYVCLGFDLCWFKYVWGCEWHHH